MTAAGWDFYGKEWWPDPEFLADPRRGSPHSRGVAVDLTLIDGDGRELEMGTRFDAFTPLSHHGSTAVKASGRVLSARRRQTAARPHRFPVRDGLGDG